MDATDLLCLRCGCVLHAGGGNFYIVRIEAFADPTPPDDSGVPAAPGEIDRLIEQMRGMSPQELMDDVYRKMTLHLCRRCYLPWIEHPVG